MRSLRVPFARLAAVSGVLGALVVVTAGCRPHSHDLQAGSYRAVIEVPGGDLPFGLDVANEESGFVLYLVNGKERVRVPEVVVETGRVTARMPGSDNTLTARISGDELEGEVALLRSGGERQVLPLKAKLGETWRFVERPLTDNADFAGRWSVTITDDEGKSSPGVAEFAQKFAVVTGTILGPTGDQRFLAGDAHGDELLLSRFDGAQAHLYRGKLNEHGELVGEHWSGKSSHERFVAVRNPDGKPVALSDARFQGKAGIVARMYEHFGDFPQAAASTRRFRKEFTAMVETPLTVPAT
ncbi:MAG: hypothetical protein FIB04_07865 [Gammaproteobacteria bacterium]|nr:hypothetical protein [Gammaproteobacteria bacterium]